MPDERTRAEMLAEAERLEAEAQALIAGEITTADTYRKPVPKSPVPHSSADPMRNVPVVQAKRSPPKRRCKARNRQGNQCGQAPAIGQEVCRMHGGAAPQAIAKARERLEAAADRMAERLLKLAENELGDGTKVGAYVQLNAVNSALDRAGITEAKQVEVTVKPFDQLLGDVTGGSRADYRRSVGHPDPEPFSLPIGQADTHRPGGPRVLGETFDGHLVLDGELADQPEHQAVRDPGESDGSGPSDDQPDYYEPGRQTLTNPVPLPNLPNGGYLPTEDALEVAQNANRNHRAKMRRR